MQPVSLMLNIIQLCFGSAHYFKASLTLVEKREANLEASFLKFGTDLKSKNAVSIS